MTSVIPVRCSKPLYEAIWEQVTCEHHNGITEVMGSIPIEAFNFLAAILATASVA